MAPPASVAPGVSPEATEIAAVLCAALAEVAAEQGFGLAEIASAFEPDAARVAAAALADADRMIDAVRKAPADVGVLLLADGAAEIVALAPRLASAAGRPVWVAGPNSDALSAAVDALTRAPAAPAVETFLLDADARERRATDDQAMPEFTQTVRLIYGDLEDPRWRPIAIAATETLRLGAPTLLAATRAGADDPTEVDVAAAPAPRRAAWRWPFEPHLVSSPEESLPDLIAAAWIEAAAELGAAEGADRRRYALSQAVAAVARSAPFALRLHDEIRALCAQGKISVVVMAVEDDATARLLVDAARKEGAPTLALTLGGAAEAEGEPARGAGRETEPGSEPGSGLDSVRDGAPAGADGVLRLEAGGSDADAAAPAAWRSALTQAVTDGVGRAAPPYPEILEAFAARR